MKSAFHFTKVWFLSMEFIMFSCLAACANDHVSDQKYEDIETLVRAFESINVDSDIDITHESAWKIKEFTHSALWNGNQDCLSKIILDVRDDKRDFGIWYPFMEMAFSDAWKERDVPIQMGASDLTVSALKAIARGGACRHSRVAAAIALRHVEPDLAKQVFLQEYAVFTISAWPEVPSPSPVGYYLRSMGIMVPSEITNVREAKIVLTLSLRQQLNSDHVALAVNLYNRKLNELLRSRRWDELAEIYSANERDLLERCLEITKNSGDYKEDED